MAVGAEEAQAVVTSKQLLKENGLALYLGTIALGAEGQGLRLRGGCQRTVAGGRGQKRPQSGGQSAVHGCRPGLDGRAPH